MSQNSFCKWLSPLGFELFPILVVDLLHEFELGVLKFILKYLLQIIYGIDPCRIDILNEWWGPSPSSEHVTDRCTDRFTQISPFGQSTIHQFPPDMADTHQWPAWFFEQVFQVLSLLGASSMTCSAHALLPQSCIPIFEGLFPPTHNESIQCLLFWLCEWHALVKLQIHTDDSLALLQQSLQCLGNQLHHFQEEICAMFHT